MNHNLTTVPSSCYL